MSKYHAYCSCIECKLELTIQNLAGHIRGTHTVKGKCLQCNTDLYNKNKFCSNSCSATYNNYLRPRMYKCKVCNIESEWTRQKENIYCSLQCSSIGQANTTIERFNRGEVSERATIRKMLTKTKGYECECCGISEYNNMPITLQVDHIDGNAGNNMPDNLRLICPNCHSQTDTFGARNKGNGRAARGLPLH